MECVFESLFCSTARWLVHVLNNNELPIYMHTVGLGLLTILIPVVLLIFSDKGDIVFPWDKIVVLDQLFKVRYSIWVIGMVFAPSFVWSDSVPGVRAFLAIIFLAGVCLQLKMVSDALVWIRSMDSDAGNNWQTLRGKLRGEFLTKASPVEKERIWGMTWSEKIVNPYDENYLTKYFCEELASTGKQEIYLHSTSSALRLYSAHVEKRNLNDFSVLERILKTTLSLHLHFFERNSGNKTADSGDSTIEVHYINSSLEQIISRCVGNSLKDGTSAWIMFRELESHLQAATIPAYRAKLLFQSVCHITFNNLTGGRELEQIWSSFPDEWKINEETLANRDSVAWYWCTAFLNWISRRATSSEKNIDFSIDSIPLHLFDTVDPILWAEIVTFHFRPWADVKSGRMISLVEGRTNFGHFGRSSADFGMITEEAFFAKLHEHSLATLRLSVLIFRDVFTKMALSEWISDLKNIPPYPKDQVEFERSREHFLKVFEELLRLVSEDAQENVNPRGEA